MANPLFSRWHEEGNAKCGRERAGLIKNTFVSRFPCGQWGSLQLRNCRNHCPRQLRKWEHLSRDPPSWRLKLPALQVPTLRPESKSTGGEAQVLAAGYSWHTSAEWMPRVDGGTPTACATLSKTQLPAHYAQATWAWGYSLRKLKSHFSKGLPLAALLIFTWTTSCHYSYFSFSNTSSGRPFLNFLPKTALPQIKFCLIFLIIFVSWNYDNLLCSCFVFCHFYLSHPMLYM